MIPTPAATNHQVWADELLQQEPVLLTKIQTATSLDAIRAKVVLVETLRFLHLVAFHQRKLTPSLAVDLAWHEFILFTHRYAAFCQTTFGRFIHHSPGERIRKIIVISSKLFSGISRPGEHHRLRYGAI